MKSLTAALAESIVIEIWLVLMVGRNKKCCGRLTDVIECELNDREFVYCCACIYTTMMRMGRGTTSYLDEEPFDRQSQCTRIPWSMLAASKT